jgi:amino acid adenylation domain-containing protein/thioester reductase-like protein
VSELFVDRLRAQVQSRSDAVAIEVDGESVFTYAQLWQRACAIAARLEGARLVALHLDRSPELVAAMVGTWLAGAAFVPVLPELPEARRRLMLEETAARHVIVADDAVPAWLREGRAIVDAREATAAAEPHHTRSADALAYVIYTSGSTGRPKGVLVSHRGIVNLLDAQIRAFELDPASRALWMLSPGFDASISDVGTALLSGATLCIERPARLRALLPLLAERAITHVDLPPSLLPLLDPAAAPPHLRTLVVGGEVAAPTAVRAWAARVRVVNVYGPTEATVCTSLGACATAWSRPLIGRPLPHVELVVVGDDGRAARTGEPGELYIGGIGLADGYLDRPELTAERFVERAGRRMFRTGDRVVEHADGEIEFLGRVDRQLKIQGALVAPEEIEARLREHRAVRDAAVVAERRGVRGVLVAYCQAEATPAELRAHLAASLPAHLVPHRIELVTGELPRTATGKLDLAVLAALPAPDRGSAEPGVLAGLWQRLLGVVPRPGASFFDLGGDSLAVVELVALARLEGIAISPEDVYAHPTIEALDAVVAASRASVARPCADLVADVERDPAWRRLVARAPAAPTRELGRVLVTGATGFLGRHVLAELLARTDAAITCLVRAPDEPAAVGRLARVLAGTASAVLAERCTVLVGDIARPRLGLAPAVWDELAAGLATIVHCAADVGLTRPYEQLRATNVTGTLHVLELAQAGAPKRLHHASTLSVFVGGERSGIIAERDPLTSARRLHGGYAQSKWAAEWLVTTAHPDAFVHRFGLLTGEAAPPHDWLRLFVRALARLGAVPRIEGAAPRFDLTPIDYASRAMAHLIRVAPPGALPFHFANPVPATLDDLAAALRRAGIALRDLAFDAWFARVREAGRAVAIALLGTSRALPDRAAGSESDRPCDLFQASGVVFDTAVTRAALADLAPPPSGPELIDRYVRHYLAESA